MGRGIGGIAQQTQGNHAIRIDRDDRAFVFRGHGVALGGDDEAGKVVGDHEGRAGGETVDQAVGGLLRCLDVGPVGEAELRSSHRVVTHAFENELVEARARPWVVDAKALVDHQRLAELIRALDRVVERVIARKPARHLHPVKDELPRLVDGLVVETAEPELVEGHDASTWPSSIVADAPGTSVQWCGTFQERRRQ